MDSKCNPVSQKRRVGVDEGLYDFTNSEIEFIYRSRCLIEEEEEEVEEKKKEDYNYAQHNNDTMCCRDTNSDTESTCQGKETSFLDESVNEVGKKILANHPEFFHSLSPTADCCLDYPEIEYSRWNDAGPNFQSCQASPVMKSIASQSCCGSLKSLSGLDEDQVDFQLVQKKTLVPEPELSDPHFPGFDDSIEEDGPYKSPGNLDDRKPPLHHRITTFGSLRKSFRGGYFGSYVVQKQSKDGSTTGNTRDVEVQHNGFFRIWFTKFRNRHFF